MHAIHTSCSAKARIVEADEREAGKRALLNLGHTFAHAFEAEAGYNGSLLHGEAVAAGMGLAFDLSVDLGFVRPMMRQDAKRIFARLAFLPDKPILPLATLRQASLLPI